MRQLQAQILTKLREPMMDSTLFFNPFQVVYMNFAGKNLKTFGDAQSSVSVTTGACSVTLSQGQFVETLSLCFPH